MVEVPSSALAIEDLIDSVDSVSIGLNDLTQYLLAADRDDEMVEAYHDALQPPVLRLVKNVLEVARRCGKPATMCGELAGNPPLTKLLVGLGARRFSVSQANFLDILQLIRDSTVSQMENIASEALQARTNKAVRLYLLEA
jgi:phosphotransferase system enzyme I (PtsI)